MIQRTTRIHTMLLIVLLGCLAVLPSGPAFSATMESIKVSEDPCSVHIVLSERVPYKTVRFASGEILVAFSGVDSGDRVVVKGGGGACIRNVNVSRARENVVSIVISTGRDVGSVSSRWAGTGELIVTPVLNVKKPSVKSSPAVAAAKKQGKQVKKGSVERPVRKTAKKPGVSRPEKKESGHGPMADHPVAGKDEKAAEPAADAARKEGKERLLPSARVEGHPDPAGRHEFEASVHSKPGLGAKTPVNQGTEPDLHQKNLLEGLKKKGGGNLKTSDELFMELASPNCGGHAGIQEARSLAGKEKWVEAFEMFDRVARDEKAGTSCREYATLLKAFCYFKDLEKSDSQFKNYVKAADHFQDLVSFYPDSPYVAYALAALGKIYLRMGDNSQAEGYFQIVRTTYKDSYPGIPEIMFELGWLYTEKNDSQLAIEMLKDVVARFPDGEFIGKAKMKLGKALFNASDFEAAIRTFEELLVEKPHMAFESHELLLYLGNACYQTGRRERALESLLKVYNLYPGMEGRDTLLTRIGDILVETGRKDQALKIFKQVTRQFPKTDGFVISSMRLAEHLEDKGEKEKIYTMVIGEYLTNPLSQLAMMRLALLQKEAGEYEKSVETAKNLLVYKPKDLELDAIQLIRDASVHIFKKLLEGGEETELIARYEADRKYLDDMDAPDVFLYTGMGYLKSHLYDKAVDTLYKAYNRTLDRNRSDALIGALAVSLDEVGRDEEAMKMAGVYVKRFPDGPESLDMQLRMGRIFSGRKQHARAIAVLRKAYEKTENPGQRTEVLMEIAKNQSVLGDFNAAATTLENAAVMLAKNPEKNAETLLPVYKDMAENLMKVKQWDRAVEVLDRALKLSTDPADLTEVHFRLGEAHQKLRNLEEADRAYSYVVENGDTFWSGMAQERLRSMNLKAKLEKNN